MLTMLNSLDMNLDDWEYVGFNEGRKASSGDHPEVSYTFPSARAEFAYWKGYREGYREGIRNN